MVVGTEDNERLSDLTPQERGLLVAVMRSGSCRAHMGTLRLFGLGLLEPCPGTPDYYQATESMITLWNPLLELQAALRAAGTPDPIFQFGPKSIPLSRRSRPDSW